MTWYVVVAGAVRERYRLLEVAERRCRTLLGARIVVERD